MTGTFLWRERQRNHHCRIVCTPNPTHLAHQCKFDPFTVIYEYHLSTRWRKSSPTAMVQMPPVLLQWCVQFGTSNVLDHSGVSHRGRADYCMARPAVSPARRRSSIVPRLRDAHHVGTVPRGRGRGKVTLELGIGIGLLES